MKTQKLFVLRKYIMASDAREAIKKERNHAVDDVWVDEDWKKGQNNQLASSLGFKSDANNKAKTSI